MLGAAIVQSAANAVPSFSTGVKIGEVSVNEAIIWARLSADGHDGDTRLNKKISSNGMSGSVQVTYWPKGSPQKASTLKSVVVDPNKDFTCQIRLSELHPQTTYLAKLRAFSESGAQGQELAVTFKTAPLAGVISPVEAVLVTCQGHETIDDASKGHWVYKKMLSHAPDFFIHTGDVVYYDKAGALPLSKTITAARHRWGSMFTYRWNRDFPSQVSSYFMKDDHDTLKNDCWPGQTYGEIIWEEGVDLFKEQTPQGPLPYRKVRWGKDLELWLIEGRDYRSPNHQPDGPDKTILGKTQKEWLKNTLKESDATFKLVVFPSPVVGPDKKGKKDNHSNSTFAHEGKELREFLSKIPHLFVVCGDRHWQYASKDPDTGLIEICCGPINNTHALRGGNADFDEKYHLYYGGGKGGYLRVAVTRAENRPKISFIWHGDQASDGEINHQEDFFASDDS